MQKCCRRNGGCFLSGKFTQDAAESDHSAGSDGTDPQQSQNRPYVAIAEACSNIIDDLLFLYDSNTNALGDSGVLDSDFFSIDDDPLQPDEPGWRWRCKDAIEKLKEERDLAILEPILPKIKFLIDNENIKSNSQNGDELVDSKGGFVTSVEGSKQAIHCAFARFFHHLCQVSSVVLLLDDLQWVDGASLELIEYLLIEESLQRLMLICTIRSDEQTDLQHPRTNVTCTRAFFERVVGSTRSAAFTEVELKKLSVINVTKWIESLLDIDEDEAATLADVVHQCTDGNALYAKEFLRTLRQDRLLNYDYKALKWQFNIDDIIESTSATRNVVEVVTSRLTGLSESCQRVLSRIAFLGSRFSYSVFEVIANDTMGAAKSVTSERSVKLMLNDLVSEGILVRDRKRQFIKWAHDKIRESALNIFVDQSPESIRVQLGSLLLSNFPQPRNTPDMFSIVDMLNVVPNGTISEGMRINLCRLNLVAGETALQSSAYSSASRYFRKGVGLLPLEEEDRWRDPYSTTLELLSGSAEAHLCIGDHKRIQEIYDEVSCRCEVVLLKKRRVFDAYHHSLVAQQRPLEALDLTMKTLKKLGCHFSRKFGGIQSMVGVVKMKRCAKQRCEKIRQLGQIRDEQKQWITHLLYRSIVAAYQSSPDIFPSLLVRGIRYILDNGIADDAAPILAIAGLVVSGVLGDFKGGREYAVLALACSNRTTESRTKFLAYEFVMHHLSPYETIKQPLIEGYEAGMRSGDLESGFWSIFSFLEVQVFASSHLQDILRNCESYTRQMEIHKETKILLFTKFVQQLVYNLATSGARGHVLKGNFMDEGHITEETRNKPEFVHEWVQLHRFKTHAAFWFGEWKRVCELIEQEKYHMYTLEHHNPGFPGIGPMYMQCALASITLYRSTGIRKHRVRAEKFYSKLKSWAGNGNRNLQHAEALIFAELHDLRGKRNAIQYYEVAILMARRYQFTADEAIAHERFADFCWRTGKKGVAKYHYNRSLRLYSIWGAYGKEEQLEQSIYDRYPEYDSVELEETNLNF